MAGTAKNFALIGVAGYIAPRHLQAIKATGNRLIAATDPRDSVGVLDQFFPQARYFPEIERFDRHLEKLRRRDPGEAAEYVSICSPNYLHDAHVRLALRLGADAICEKPLVISPWNLDALAELERESGRRVFTILPLRYHASVTELRDRLAARGRGGSADICLTYITPRGAWYPVSWKGSPEKSGGIAMNIGIHFFDLLIWLFGGVRENGVHVHVAKPQRMAGVLELASARVRWFLSVDFDDLPIERRSGGFAPFRQLTIDGEEIQFSDGLKELHTVVYEQILAGHGFGIDEARPSIEAVHAVRSAGISSIDAGAHPYLHR